jgi:uncharacterized membrane protein YgcG
VYTSAKTGHLYVRAHEKKDNDFIFFVSDDGSNWSPASSIPDDLFSTRRVVPELRGVPSGKVEEEELAEEEVIDENTTEAEADAVDSDTGADADGGSGDSGGDGGGDGGGGDGGGSESIRFVIGRTRRRGPASRTDSMENHHGNYATENSGRT